MQHENNQAINEALNETYLHDEDAQALRNSITNYENFEQLKLAAKLENHDLKEMRRLASLLYRRNKKFAKSLELSKKDKE